MPLNKSIDQSKNQELSFYTPNKVKAMNTLDSTNQNDKTKNATTFSNQKTEYGNNSNFMRKTVNGGFQSHYAYNDLNSYKPPTENPTRFLERD